MNKDEPILLEVLSSLLSFIYHLPSSQRIFVFKIISFILSCLGKENILLPSRGFRVSGPTPPNYLRKSYFISSSFLQYLPSLLPRGYFSFI